MDITKVSPLNTGYLCTGYQIEKGLGEKIAMRLIQPDLSFKDYTFTDLDQHSNQFANVMQQIGLQSGEIMTIYLPVGIPELYTGFLGILKAGGVACNVFSNMGKDALYTRLEDSASTYLLTKKSLYKRLKKLIDDLPSLKKIILVDLEQDEMQDDPKIINLQKLLSTASQDFSPVHNDLETPYVLHYTSGSTGKPKGVIHVQQAIVHQLRTIEEVLQLNENDIYWCTADPGWVTGTTYGITAPWMSGVTQIVNAGGFNPVDWFQIVQDQKITVWYTAPTALRMLMRDEDKFKGKFDLSNLDRMYSVGEPLNPEIVRWVKKTLDKQIYDTWFQTETNAIMISNRPGLAVKDGSMGKPLSTIQPRIGDDQAEALPVNQTGRLLVKAGWESMMRGYWKNEEAYQKKFQNGWYDTNDLAYQDEDGYYWFVGRNDDVINTSGHLVGPFEVESALLELNEIVEAAVIGAPDPMLFEKVVTFIVLKKGAEWNRKLEIAIRIHITNKLGPIAVPLDYVIMDDLPKNQSGKILRRVLKANYLGEDAGDTSTMA